MKRAASVVAVLFAVCFGPGDSTAWAWGNDGHRIVGEIAWQQMTPAARDAARKFLPSGRYGVLYEAATWPDSYARMYERYDWVKPLHYVDADSELDDIEVEPRCECVVGAIARFSEQLTDESQRYGYRVNALRFVAHFVGDVHQPLHTGHPDGIGGNRTSVRFDGQRTNLHSLWDSGLLRYHLQRAAAPPARDPWEPEIAPVGVVPTDWEGYALSLLAEITDEEIEEWTRDLDPEHWATESRRLARQHIYEVAPGARLDAAYYEAAMPVIELRLKQAGVRLGALLNELLDPQEE